MLKTRVIPTLLIDKDGLYKTTKFGDPVYIGDPINAVRIFNEKEVDELAILDITASSEKRRPNYELISRIAAEAFMPLAYGGGITSVEDVKKLCKLGVEKVVLNTQASISPDVITSSASVMGSQSVVASIDVKKNWRGKYNVYTHRGTLNTKVHPVSYAQRMESSGAGEILLNSIDRDGTMKGYDLDLIRQVSDAVSIPVVAIGGAGALTDFQQAIVSGASAVSAGAFFVFQGKHRAVLITYPQYEKLETLLKSFN